MSTLPANPGLNFSMSLGEYFRFLQEVVPAPRPLQARLVVPRLVVPVDEHGLAQREPPVLSLVLREAQDARDEIFVASELANEIAGRRPQALLLEVEEGLAGGHLP